MNEKNKQLRATINSEIRTRAKHFKVAYGLVWWSAYENLSRQTGYRPPEDAKNRLDCVQAAGHLHTLLRVVRKMRRPRR